MKRILLMMTIPLLLAACGSTSGLQSFDHSELDTQREDAAFQPELPTELPFEVSNAELTLPPEVQRPAKTLTFDFYGEEQEHLSLLTVNGGDVSSTSGQEYEDVQIGESDGEFFVDEEDTKTLRWKQGEVQYVLKYLSGQSETEVTKEQLISVSESFE